MMWPLDQIQKAINKKRKYSLKQLGLLIMACLSGGVAIRELQPETAYLISSVTLTILVLMGLLYWKKV